MVSLSVLVWIQYYSWKRGEGCAILQTPNQFKWGVCGGWWWPWQCWLSGWTGDLRGIFPPLWFNKFINFDVLKLRGSPWRDVTFGADFRQILCTISVFWLELVYTAGIFFSRKCFLLQTSLTDVFEEQLKEVNLKPVKWKMWRSPAPSFGDLTIKSQKIWVGRDLKAVQNSKRNVH